MEKTCEYLQYEAPAIVDHGSLLEYTGGGGLAKAEDGSCKGNPDSIHSCGV
jgi:hypothetical protein